MWWKSSTYASLQTDDDDEAEKQSVSNTGYTQLNRHRDFQLTVHLWLGQLIFFVILSSVFYFGAWNGNKYCHGLDGPPITQEYALAVAAVGSRSPSTSEGNFFAISEYGGVPTREIDERWDNLTETGTIPISRAEMIRLNKLVPSSVRWDEYEDEVYQAGIQVFHYIHCLNVIRKWTYIDHYRAEDPTFYNLPTSRIHKDHCIEMLRQVLMCNSDLHLWTYNWVDRVNHAWPDFGTTQMCRNFEDVRQWSLEHAISTSEPDGSIKQPENALKLHVPSDKELHIGKFGSD